MPCTDGGPSIDDGAEIRHLRNRIDHLAQILCKLSDKLEADYPILLDELLQNDGQYATWLKKHKVLDAARKASEKKKEEREHREKLERAKKILSSLTEEERKEMGLP